MSRVDALSVQLYSGRHVQPLARQLGILRELGYRAVEPYGAQLDDADGLVEAVAAHGMTAPSMHVGLDRLDAAPAAVAATAARLGTGLIAVPFLAADSRPADAAGWRAFGARLGAIRRRLADHGIRLAWHNHDFEFVPTSGGALPLDCLLDADPELLWQADIGWIHRAGHDPVAWLKHYRGRIASCHVKDVSPDGAGGAEDGWADVGTGVLDWAALLPAIDGAGPGGAAPILVAEHDNPSDFERFARRSRAAVAQW